MSVDELLDYASARVSDGQAVGFDELTRYTSFAWTPGLRYFRRSR
jgi:hypothetical protein